MKKIYTIIILGIILSPAFGQERVANSTPSSPLSKTKTLVKSVAQSQPQLKSGPLSPAVAFSDDFSMPNDTTGLKARGYIPYYRGTGPQGTTATWFQGNSAVFPAFNGAADSYVAANYNAVTGTNTIDNWLVLPALNIAAGDVISFYSQSPAGSTFPDSIKVMYSAIGDSVPEALTWVMIGEFKVNTAGMWELKSFTAPVAGLTARFAIRYSVVNAGPSGSNSDYIGIDQLDVLTPAATDGGVSSIDPIASGCGLSATTPITVTITNYGATDISNFPVSFTVNAGTPVVEVYAGTITAGNSASYTFTGTADLSAPGSYTIDASTNIPLDGNSGNDGSSISVTNTAATAVTLGMPFTEGFESVAVGTIPPTGWLTEDTDGDGNSWDFANTFAHNGTMCSRVPFPTGAPAENWLFTPCLDLLSGVNYQIEYWYKSFDVTQNSFQLETRFGTSQSSAAMTNNIAVDPLFPDSSYHLALHTFNVPSDGVYYIGFNGFSAAAQLSMRMDDASISVITGINEIDHALDFQVYPTITSGIVNIKAKINDSNMNLSVYNNQGQKVYSSKFNSAFKTSIDLSAFASGVYTIQLITSGNVISRKINIEK